jgi:hypothetical protein
MECAVGFIQMQANPSIRQWATERGASETGFRAVCLRVSFAADFDGAFELRAALEDLVIERGRDLDLRGCGRRSGRGLCLGEKREQEGEQKTANEAPLYALLPRGKAVARPKEQDMRFRSGCGSDALGE